MKRNILLSTIETEKQWAMTFYANNTVDMFDNKQNLLGTYKWHMQNETVFVLKNDHWWMLDNMLSSEDDRCSFYTELYYAIAEQELLK